MIPGRTTAAAFALLVSCSWASADPYVKITQAAGKDGAGTDCSSATLIGWTTDCKKGIFLSCAHGFDSYNPVEIQFEHDRQSEGRIIAINRRFDLSLIEAPVESSTTMVALADKSPHERDAVQLIGFPDKQFSNSVTRIKGRFWSRNACTPQWTLYQAKAACVPPDDYQELLVTEAASVPGLSGGALLQNKKLAGVVIGKVSNAKNAGLVVPAETVRLFVRRNISLFYRKNSRGSKFK